MNPHLHLVLLVCVLCSRANAWWDEGHSTVAEIAQQTLPYAFQKIYPHLSRDKIDDMTSSLQKLFKLWQSDDGIFRIHEASVWPDYIKENDYGITSMKEWHFIDLPYYTPPLDSDTMQNVTNAMWRATSTVSWNILECMKTLETYRKHDWAKAFQLRNLLHFVGDISQPFHCINGFFHSSYLRLSPHDDPEWSDLFHSAVDKRYHEDRGGNLFAISLDFNTDIYNLHFLWDSVGGEYTSRSPYDNITLSKIQNNATQLMLLYPLQSHFKTDDAFRCDKSTIHEWANESHALAIKFGYQALKPHALLNRHDKALQDIISVAKQQLTKGGYRLAVCLAHASGLY